MSTDPDSTAETRRAYAHRLAQRAGRVGTRLEEAFAATPREHFVGPPPWLLMGSDLGRMPSSDPHALYQDVLVGLDVERGINNGQPSLHAACLAACDPRPGDTVVHVG